MKVVKVCLLCCSGCHKNKRNFPDAEQETKANRLSYFPFNNVESLSQCAGNCQKNCLLRKGRRRKGSGQVGRGCGDVMPMFLHFPPVWSMYIGEDGKMKSFNNSTQTLKASLLKLFHFLSSHRAPASKSPSPSDNALVNSKNCHIFVCLFIWKRDVTFGMFRNFPAAHLVLLTYFFNLQNISSALGKREILDILLN